MAALEGAPDARPKNWIPACAGMTALEEASGCEVEELDSRLRDFVFAGTSASCSDAVAERGYCL
jgi:hypothetical protein